MTQLNLAPIMFLPHAALDAYAFVGGRMFTFNPSTRRAAEQSAIEELESPFVVVDTRHRIVDLNPAAEATFDVTSPTVLGERLENATDLDVELTAGDQIVTDDSPGEFRELAVSVSELHDLSRHRVGYTILIQDITSQRRREQRLEILNRILRHNLRNDLNVVEGYLDIAADRTSDEDYTKRSSEPERTSRMSSTWRRRRGRSNRHSTRWRSPHRRSSSRRHFQRSRRMSKR